MVEPAHDDIEITHDDVEAAARFLIGVVRVAEDVERGRCKRAAIAIAVEPTAGGREQRQITVERIASTH